MNFGEAIEELKNNKKVARKGWNGEGMFIFLDRDFVILSGHSKEYSDDCDPCIVMYTAAKTYQPGWLASQADILAEDWEVVE